MRVTLGQNSFHSLNANIHLFFALQTHHSRISFGSVWEFFGGVRHFFGVVRGLRDSSSAIPRLSLIRTSVVLAPYMRRTFVVHTSAKVAFFMLNIEKTTPADVYTAYLRLRYDARTTQVGSTGRIEGRNLYPTLTSNIYESFGEP